MSEAKLHKPLPRVRPRFKMGAERMGWVAIWLVDDQNRSLHTEPVCSIPVGDVGHRWFAEWLEQQECPVMMPGFPDE
jgi:hypothetical protein